MGYHSASLGVLWMVVALSNTIDVIPGRKRNHGHDVCSTWGNNHFKTFDGDYYQFPGKCTYNLASDCRDSYQEFSVHIHRSTDSDHPLIDKITITVKDVIIQLKKNLAVVDGAIARTPFYMSGILIHKNDAYFKVYTKIGLTVMWNKEDAVMLELDPKYKNHTCGLCGDYNGVPIHGEFLSGDIILSPAQFGNLQNIDDPNDECTDVDETLFPSTDHCFQYHSVCEEHLGNAAFSDCKDLLNVDAFTIACMMDMCSCSQSQDSFCLCSTISEFSRQCSHAGGHPGNWRTDSFCPKQCPTNMIYQESASPCKNSCSRLEIHSLCEEHNMDGCFCPEGTVQDDYTDRGCVAVSACHCKHRGTLYAPGETIQKDCDECRCELGRWNCTDRACPGVCSIEGGSHITTFDGKAYTYHGNCYYVLSKGRGNESHVVLGELAPCSSSKRESCLKSVVLLTDNMQNVVTFKADGTVLLNSLEVTLPHTTASFSIMQPSDSYIFAQATFGVQMQIQLSPIMQMYITVDKSARRKLEGLCGNFNSKETDDFKTSGGLVEATASAFANTWKAQSTCQDMPDFLDDPCSLSIEKEKYGSSWCSELEKDESPFAKCHSTIDPTEYIKRCRYDSCSCKDSEQCMCAALSSYVKACAAKGIILWGWRNGICDQNITSCPSSQVFLYNLTTCQPTCRSLADGEKACTSVFAPVEGCGCPNGEFLNEKGLCVPIAKCSCYHRGEYLRPLQMIPVQDELCTCRNGKLTCTVHVNQTCPAGKVYYDCNKEQKDLSKTPMQRSCKTLGVEYFQTECLPGCICPNGLYDDGFGGCVPEEKCPCFHNEDIYPHGTNIKVDCNTCLCQRGRWTCTDTVCYGTCTIYGSGHYITFDDKLYDFDGECEFVAAQDYCGPNQSDGSFSIITENVRCGTTGVTCSKSIKVFLGNEILKLAEKTIQKMEGQGGKHVDYLTREVGIYLVIEISNGIILIWDRKTTMFIKVSPAYKGKLCGLCGNFDDNSQNDFKTSHMLPVTDVLEFGNSWKYDPTCPEYAAIINPCNQNPHRRSWAEKQCSLIKGQMFQACHSKVDPKPFYEACVSDACSCDSGGDCDCFCTAVAAYGQECTKAGICVYWRTPDICPIFCDYYNPKDECEWHYHPCGNHNIETCRSINNVYTNVTITYLEGCYPSCPPEKPIFDEETKICVTKENCGCYVNNTHYEIGKEVPVYRDCYKCVCHSGKIDCTVTDYNDTTSMDNGLCKVTTCENGNKTIHLEVCASTTPRTTSTTPVTSVPVTITTVVTTPLTTTTPYSSTTCVFEKVCQWSQWFDISKPGDGLDSGDYETYDEIRKHYKLCSVPEQIQCRAVNAPDVSLKDLKQTVHCNVSNGLICQNSEQKPDDSLWQKCYNYEIRVDCCDYECVKTTAPTTTKPTTTTPATTITTVTSTITTPATPTATTPVTTPHTVTTPTTTTSAITTPATPTTSVTTPHTLTTPTTTTTSTITTPATPTITTPVTTPHTVTSPTLTPSTITTPATHTTKSPVTTPHIDTTPITATSTAKTTTSGTTHSSAIPATTPTATTISTTISSTATTQIPTTPTTSPTSSHTTTQVTTGSVTTHSISTSPHTSVSITSPSSSPIITSTATTSLKSSTPTTSSPTTATPKTPTPTMAVSTSTTKTTTTISSTPHTPTPPIATSSAASTETKITEVTSTPETATTRKITTIEEPTTTPDVNIGTQTTSSTVPKPPTAPQVNPTSSTTAIQSTTSKGTEPSTVTTSTSTTSTLSVPTSETVFSSSTTKETSPTVVTTGSVSTILSPSTTTAYTSETIPTATTKETPTVTTARTTLLTTTGETTIYTLTTSALSTTTGVPATASSTATHKTTEIQTPTESTPASTTKGAAPTTAPSPTTSRATTPHTSIASTPTPATEAKTTSATSTAVSTASTAKTPGTTTPHTEPIRTTGEFTTIVTPTTSALSETTGVTAITSSTATHKTTEIQTPTESTPAPTTKGAAPTTAPFPTTSRATTPHTSIASTPTPATEATTTSATSTAVSTASTGKTPGTTTPYTEPIRTTGEFTTIVTPTTSALSETTGVTATTSSTATHKTTEIQTPTESTPASTTKGAAPTTTASATTGETSATTTAHTTPPSSNEETTTISTHTTSVVIKTTGVTATTSPTTESKTTETHTSTESIPTSTTKSTATSTVTSTPFISTEAATPTASHYTASTHSSATTVTQITTSRTTMQTSPEFSTNEVTTPVKATTAETTTKNTAPSTITEVFTTIVTATGPTATHEAPSTTGSETSPITTSITTIPVTHNTQDTTITSSTMCVCVYNGTSYTPGEITSGVTDETCYKVICDPECQTQVQHWPCSTTTPTSSPKTSLTSIQTPPSTQSTATTTPSTTPRQSSTTVTKTTISTTEVKTTPTTGCILDRHYKEDEVWSLCNCTKARCLENNTVEITHIKCDPPPKIKCANGRPPVPVPDEDLCCWHWECECVCSGWGDHYSTFDGTYYSFQGNCTYALVEEIEKKTENFGIYVDNFDCGSKDRVSCSRNVIIRYETQEIQMKKKSLPHTDVQVVINGEVVGVPYKKYGVNIYKVGINHIVEIPELKTNVTFNGEDFSVKVPSNVFAKNTQGQCGTCSNDQTDDCRTSSGEIVSSCAAMADTWIVHDSNKPKCDQHKPTQPPPTTEPSVVCPPSPVCDLMMGQIFEKCHEIVPPNDYYQACVSDSCHGTNSNMPCTSLQHYALLCGDHGICIDWRSQAAKCPMECPSHQVYNACGSAVSRTCQTTPEEQSLIKSDKRVTEGCFCPVGTIPFSPALDVCVSTCGCVGPDRIPREFGEEFQSDCQQCVCREGGSGITCQKRQCSKVKPIKCDLEGFYADVQINHLDPCCNESVCKCDPKKCSTNPPICDLGFEAIGDIPEGHCCTVYTCVRKKVCVREQAEYLPGAPVYSDKCQNCVCSENASTPEGIELQCTPVQCNIQCSVGFELKQHTNDCCGVCEQTHCVLSRDGLDQLIKPGENKRSEDNCTMYSCTMIKDQFITSISSISCPAFNEENCEPGTIEVLPNGCCKICIEKSTGCKAYQDYDYLYDNNCQSREKVKIARCDGLCETLSVYSAAARSMSHTCSCCQEVKTSKKKVMMQCADGSQVEHEYIDVEECNCVSTDCMAAQSPTKVRRSLK